MPYIKPEVREVLDVPLPAPRNKGELNYCITRLLIHYVSLHGLGYQDITDAVGAAEDAAAEMRRRVLAPYEDRKARENGDVYPLDLIMAADRG